MKDNPRWTPSRDTKNLSHLSSETKGLFKKRETRKQKWSGVKTTSDAFNILKLFLKQQVLETFQNNKKGNRWYNKNI